MSKINRNWFKRIYKAIDCVSNMDIIQDIQEVMNYRINSLKEEELTAEQFLFEIKYFLLNVNTYKLDFFDMSLIYYYLLDLILIVFETKLKEG